MYYLACCDNEGKCFGFLRKDRTVSKNPDAEKDRLMSFKKKSDSNQIVWQINLSQILPDGYPFRVVAIKG